MKEKQWFYSQNFILTFIIKLLGPYSQHFIFFVTYELAQLARVLSYSKLEMLVREEQSSLFDSFVSYVKNEVLWIRALSPKY